MSDERQLFWLRVLAAAGAVLLVGSHSTVIPDVYARALGELSAAIGAGAAAWSALRRPGDVQISSLPVEIQDSVRPSKAP